MDSRKLQDQGPVGDSEVSGYPADELHIGVNNATGEMAIVLDAEPYSLYVAADKTRAIQIRDHISRLIDNEMPDG